MTKTLRQAVFLRLTLFFIAGITIQTHWNLYPLWIYTGILSLPILAVSFCPSMVRSYQWRWLFGFGLFLLYLSLAGILSWRQWQISEWKGDAEKHTYHVQILDDPVKKPKTLMFPVSVNDQKALIYIPADSLATTLLPADRLLISAQFEKTEQMFHRKEGIAACAFVRKNQWVKQDDTENQPFNLRFKSLEYRRALLNRLREIISGEKSFAVGAALLFGYTQNLGRDLRQTFAATGVSHICRSADYIFRLFTLFFISSFLLRETVEKEGLRGRRLFFR